MSDLAALGRLAQLAADLEGDDSHALVGWLSLHGRPESPTGSIGPLRYRLIEDEPRRRWVVEVILLEPRQFHFIEEDEAECDDCWGSGCGRCSYGGIRHVQYLECSWCHDVVADDEACHCEDVEDWPDGRPPSNELSESTRQRLAELHYTHEAAR